MLGVSSRSPNHMIYGELGKHHLSVLSSTRCVKYWLRLNKLSSNRYVKMTHNMLTSMADEGKEKWASAVRDLLCTNGFAFAWWNGSLGYEIRLLTEFQQRLKDCFIQNWHSRLESCWRYEAYRTFKNDLEKKKFKRSGRDRKSANKENLRRVQTRNHPDTDAKASVHG